MADKAANTDPFGRVFEIRPGLLQEDVAAFGRAFQQMPRVGAPETWQAALQAGMVADWVASPDVAVTEETDLATGARRFVYRFDGVDVNRLTAAEVRFYGKALDNEYARLTTVPNPKK